MTRGVLAGSILVVCSLAACGYEEQARSVEKQAAASLAGSSNIDISKSASKKITTSEQMLGNPVVRTAYYAIRLSDAYKALGDRAALNRDEVSAGLIGLAGAAALGNASAVGTKTVLKVLAAGAVIDQGVKYVAPDSVAAAFYEASGAMSCAGSRIVKYYHDNTTVNAYATATALFYVKKIELTLRARLHRVTPDFKSLVKNTEDLIKALEAKSNNKQVSDRAINRVLSTDANVELMAAELEKCVPVLKRPGSGTGNQPDQGGK